MKRIYSLLDIIRMKSATLEYNILAGGVPWEILKQKIY